MGHKGLVIYYPSPQRNGTAWKLEMTKLVLTLNRILFDGVRALDAEWRGVAGRVQWIDTHRLSEMYHHLARFFNGSISVNVTGHYLRFPDPDDWRQ